MDALQVAAAAFVALLPITNPIGAIAAYAGMTSDMSHGDRTRQAVKTGMYVAAILVVFALLGSVALKGLGITVPALQIAGGLVVAHSGFSMLSAQPRLTSNEQPHAIAQNDVSFSPMALPLIAGPGAIGVVIALSARNPDLLDRIGVACAGAALGAVIAVVPAIRDARGRQTGPHRSRCTNEGHGVPDHDHWRRAAHPRLEGGIRLTCTSGSARTAELGLRCRPGGLLRVRERPRMGLSQG